MSESAELEPWQQRALEKMKSFKGRGTIQITGRNSGKSQILAYKRLFDDVFSQPISDLILDEGTVYGSRYYTVEPVGGNWHQMELWCFETFGDAGDKHKVWGEVKSPEPLQRWYMNNRKFWFKNRKDLDWFVLRWSS
jgi:hypothetical protein